MPRMDRPISFRPIFKSAIWGGRRLADMYPNAPLDVPLAEVWVLSDVAENASVTKDGVSLRTLMDDNRAEMLGDERHGQFPLLVKIIDAQQPLSVQVHPDDDAARRLNVAVNGKTEAWIVLRADPGSKIYAGIKPGTTAETIRQSLPNGPVDHWLHSFEPKVGDTVFLRAGTVHALGAGIVVAEVQQTCDVTYRLFDWGRVDPRTGQSRELHVEQALECIDYSAGPLEPMNGAETITCPYFELIRRDATWNCDGPGGRILIGLKGISAVNGLPFGPGRLLFLPAKMDSATVNLQLGGSVLECRIPI